MNQIAIRPLTPREVALLNECEETIAAGLTTFIDVGGALLTIHEGRLYRREFATFDEYCTAKWQIGRAYAYRLMEAVRTLLTLGDTGVPLPTNEAQARALAGVPEERRTEVWEKAHERTGGQPTAAAVRAAAEETAGLAGPAPDAEQASVASGTAPEGDTCESPSGAPQDAPDAVPVAGPSEAAAVQPAAAPDHPGSSSPGEGAASTGAPVEPAETTPEGLSTTAGAGPSAPADPLGAVLGAIDAFAAETGICPACQRPLETT